MSAVIRYDYLFIDANHKTFNQIIKLITNKRTDATLFQERDAARQLFKGATGEKLRKEIVKQSYHPTEETEAERIAQIKRREDQQKIKVTKFKIPISTLQLRSIDYKQINTNLF